MLVLTRKRDESIMIGDDIKITIVDVRGDQVKIGIEAPRSIPVHREEVYREIQEENRRAAARARAADLERLEGLLGEPGGAAGGESGAPPGGARAPRPGGPAPERGRPGGGGTRS